MSSADFQRFDWESPMAKGDYDYPEIIMGGDHGDIPYEYVNGKWIPVRTPIPHPIKQTQTGFNMNFSTRTTTDRQDELIAGALGKAIRHAQRVCVREHIKADRVERVNLFLTSLRREVSYLESHNHSIPVDLRQWLQTMLCEKAYWHDIGITTASGHNLFGNWLQMAKRQSHSADAQSEMILADLEELERGLSAVQSTVHDVERINKEGDVLVTQLCEVFQ